MFRRLQCDGDYVYGSRINRSNFCVPIVTAVQVQRVSIGSCVFVVVVVVLTFGIVRWVNVVEVQNNVFNMNPGVKTFV
jgi:hypothetical protein